MDDRNRAKEKENKEYEEFLKLFHDKYAADTKTVNSAPAENLSLQSEQKKPQERLADRPISRKIETDKGETAHHPLRKSRNANNRKRIRVVACATFAAIILTVLIVVLCTSGTDVLKGTWDLDGITVYRFNGKGAGSLDLPSDSYAFTYKIKDNTLTIDFKSDAAKDKTYTFTTDENRLTLTDSEGDAAKAFELTKQEN